MVRVLVSKHIYAEAVERLRAEVSVDYHDSDESLSAAGLRARVADKAGIVCQLTDRIDAALLGAAPGLRVVANVAVGYDNVDLEAARAHGENGGSGASTCSAAGTSSEPPWESSAWAASARRSRDARAVSTCRCFVATRAGMARCPSTISWRVPISSRCTCP